MFREMIAYILVQLTLFEYILNFDSYVYVNLLLQ